MHSDTNLLRRCDFLKDNRVKATIIGILTNTQMAFLEIDNLLKLTEAVTEKKIVYCLRDLTFLCC